MRCLKDWAALYCHSMEEEMISYIRGELAALEEDKVIVDDRRCRIRDFYDPDRRWDSFRRSEVK